MRTIEEILKRIKEIGEGDSWDDFFGVRRGNLIDFLPFKYAKKYLKKGVGVKKWSKSVRPLTKKAVIKEVKNYMSFAWEKANNCRGISANRSIDHMKAYLWLLNDGSFEKMEKIEYEHYGKEKLVFVCEHLGIDYKEWDDGERRNTDY